MKAQSTTAPKVGSGTSLATPRLDRTHDRRRLVALWLVAIAPLAWVPGGLTQFVFAKLLFTVAAALVALSVPRAGSLPRSLLAAGWVWLAVVVVAAGSGETPWASLVGRWPRHEGIPVLMIYGLSAWVGARIVGRGENRLVQVGHALAALSLTLTSFTVLDLAGTSPLGTADVDRSGSLLGNATDQGVVAMMVALVLAPRALQLRGRLEVVAFGGALVTVAVSGSRTALGLTVLGLVVTAVLQRRVHRSSGLRPYLLGALGLVVLLVAALAVPASRGRLLGLSTGRSRLELWKSTWGVVQDHLLLGIGPSRFVDVLPGYESVAGVRSGGPRQLPDSSHNAVLQLLVVGGIPLLVCTSVALWLLVRRLVVVLDEAPEMLPLAVAVVAYAASLLINFTAAGPTCLAAALLGALVARPVVGADPPGRLRLVAAPALLALVVLLVMSGLAEVQLRSGLVSAASGDAASARAHLESARSWRPWDSDVSMLGAGIMAAAGRAGDASAARTAGTLAKASLSRTPHSYDSLVSLALSYVEQDDPDAAAAALDAAVLVAPRRPDALVYRASLRAVVGDRDGAISDAERVLEVLPRSPVAHQILREMRALGRP